MSISAPSGFGRFTPRSERIRFPAASTATRVRLRCASASLPQFLVEAAAADRAAERIAIVELDQAPVEQRALALGVAAAALGAPDERHQGGHAGQTGDPDGGG